MDFIGEKCVLCGKVFTDSDDVVVCPECGSPHHRDCYKIDNKCANIALHDTGEKWKRSGASPENEEKQPFTVCPHCHFPNASSEEKCVRCGLALGDKPKDTAAAGEQGENDQDDAVLRQFLGFDPEEDLGGATLREVTQFVGPNTLYYIPIFKRMKDLGSKISFNITCLLFPPLYFANRKMWLWTILSAVISVALSMPASVLIMAEQNLFAADILEFINSHTNMINAFAEICGMFSWLIRLAFCLFGNWLYMRFTLRTLRKLHSRNGGRQVSPAVLASVGGVQPVNIILALLIMLAMTFVAVLSTAILLPVVIMMI